MFNVDTLLQQRFPQLSNRRWLFKAFSGVLKYLLHEKEFIQFQKEQPYTEGIDFVDQVLDYFNFSYSITQRDRERIPASGRVVIVSNHPIGSLDGLALIQLVRHIRPDVKILANDMLMTLKPLQKLLLPVNNMGGKTPKQNLTNITQYLEQEGAVIIFPAGEVSRMKLSGVKDGKWHSGFVGIARTAKAPVLPLFVDARNSISFYLTSMLYKPLATLLLVKEMTKQSKKTVTIKAGDMIPVEQFSQLQLAKKEVARLFRKHLYRIGSDRKPVFSTQASIAHPESPSVLHSALKQQTLLGETPDGKSIFLCRGKIESVILREIGRLRELSFRAVGEGTGNKRDTDKFDHYYYHLVLWDKDALEIVGAYRFCDTQKVISEQGMEGLYTNSLFAFDENMNGYFSQAIELGRSFVQPKYWGKRSLDYLWYGIGAFLQKEPRFRYLFGAVSLSDHYPKASKDLLVYFYSLYFSEQQTPARSFNPYNIEASVSNELKDTFVGNDYKKDFTQLKSLLANMGVAIPTLYKQYTELCEPGGVKFLDFGVDADFAGCVDGLVLVDIDKLKQKKRKRYLETGKYQNDPNVDKNAA